MSVLSRLLKREEKIVAMGVMPVRGKYGFRQLDYRFAAEELKPREIIEKCVEHGINAIGIVVKDTDGACMWESELCPNPTKRDILGEFLDEIREHGIASAVSFTCFNDAVGIRRFPDKISITKNGALNIFIEPEMILPDGRRYHTGFMCPLKYQEYLLDLAEELVRKYPIDAFFADYIRYNRPDVCYCDADIKKFKEHGNLKDTFILSPKRLKFREMIIYEFARKLYKRIKSVRRDTLVGAFVIHIGKILGSIYYAQNWSLLDRTLDIISPMVYPYLMGSIKDGVKWGIIGGISFLIAKAIMIRRVEVKRAIWLPITNSVEVTPKEFEYQLNAFESEYGIAIFKYFGTTEAHWEIIKRRYGRF